MKKNEIVSFNTEMMNFDVNDVTLEELERRLELALVPLPSAVLNPCTTDCGCPMLKTGCTCNSAQ